MTPLSNSILSASATPGAPSPATSGSREQLAKAAKDFEAIFVRQMLSSARKASAGLGEDLFGNDATETFRDMQDSRLADTMAQSGAIGLAKQIEAHLARFAGGDANPGTGAPQDKAAS
ncbi:MAG TPA: rod-binding protein [Novosphingobium sp.]